MSAYCQECDCAHAIGEHIPANLRPAQYFPRLLCPKCQSPLSEVLYPSNCMLNRDQWESQLAGDLFCACHNNFRGNKPYAYFWERELETMGGNPMKSRPRYYLGCSTLHILGRHYVNIWLAGHCVFEFEYGKDYMNAVRFVREANVKGSL